MSPLALCCVLAAAPAIPAQLSLDQALQLAKANQPSLKASQAAADAAHARERSAMAPLLPQVSTGITYSRATSNIAPQAGVVSNAAADAQTISLNSSDYWTGNLTASGTLWDFGRSWNRYHAAQATAHAQDVQVENSWAQTALQVRTAYFQAAAQRELVEVAQATLTNTEAHQKQVEGFVKVGARPEIDLAQTHADTANARLALVNARTGGRLALARLQQLLGLTAAAQFEVSSAAPGPVAGEDLPLESLVAEARDARPDLKALDAQLEAQGLTLRSVNGGYWPILGAKVAATLGARSLAQPVPNLSAQLSLTWPLYEGGATSAAVNEANANLAQQQAQREVLDAQVWLDLQTALLGVSSAREAVEVAQDAVDAAKERLRLAEGRYQAGAGSILELGDAQVGFTQTSAQRVQAQWSLATARAQLLAALGRE